MEAQTQALACLSTRAAAVAELIENGVTGHLVEPDDVPALAAALEALIRDPSRRAALGDAGAARVRRDFGCEAGIDRLFTRFTSGESLASFVRLEGCCALHK